MMRLPSFDYVAPKTVDEAVRAMRDAGPDGMLVAGGTDLYPNLKRRQFEPGWSPAASQTMSGPTPVCS